MLTLLQIALAHDVHSWHAACWPLPGPAGATVSFRTSGRHTDHSRSAGDLNVPDSTAKPAQQSLIPKPAASPQHNQNSPGAPAPSLQRQTPPVQLSPTAPKAKRRSRRRSNKTTQQHAQGSKAIPSLAEPRAAGRYEAKELAEQHRQPPCQPKKSSTGGSPSRSDPAHATRLADAAHPLMPLSSVPAHTPAAPSGSAAASAACTAPVPPEHQPLASLLALSPGIPRPKGRGRLSPRQEVRSPKAGLHMAMQVCPAAHSDSQLPSAFGMARAVAAAKLSVQWMAVTAWHRQCALAWPGDRRGFAIHRCDACQSFC